MHTSRLLKSADKPDGLAYNKSQPGREALSVCWQLGTDYTGPMGPASHNRVPVRAYPNPTSSQATPGDLMLKGGGEHSGRPGIEGIEGQMRLDAKSSCFQSDPIPDGPMRDRSLCIASNKIASKVFQLETGSRSRGHRCLQPELGDGKVLC